MTGREVCGSEGPAGQQCLGPAEHPPSTMCGNGALRWWRHDALRPGVAGQEEAADRGQLLAGLVGRPVTVDLLDHGQGDAVVGVLAAVAYSPEQGYPEALWIDTAGASALVPWHAVAALWPEGD